MTYDIKIGSTTNPTFEFTADTLLSNNIALSVDVVGDNLTIDVGTPTVWHDKDEVELFAPSDYDAIETSDGYTFASSWTAGDLRDISYGTPVWIYNNDTLKVKMYVENVERLGKYEYQLNLISAVGLLDKQNFVGNLYTGTLFKNVVADIIGGTVGTQSEGVTPITGGVVDCYVENDVASQQVFGHLPVCTKREALHQLMFAYNTILTKDSNGDIVFSFLYNTTPTAISDNNIFMGSSVDYTAPASKIELTEHTYEVLGDEEEIVLFDNTTSGGVTADHTYVYFDDAPIIESSLDFGNLTDEGHGVNYAIVTGTGILKGKPYTHVRYLITRSRVTNQEEKVVTVEDATLVTTANSENVADRLMAYYGSQKTINADIVLTDESCGRLVSFTDPYDSETVSGFISTMDISYSATNKASCTIIKDYTPTGSGNNYQNAVVLTGTGTWTIPASVFLKDSKTIKAILIGGGQGGYKGGNGSNGTEASFAPSGAGGAGGTGGNGGSGGKIYSQVIDCTGLTSFSYSCGSGGAINGGAGGDTSFSSYSSSSGSTSQYGVINLFTSAIYAKAGTKGYDGGQGNTGGSSITINGQTWRTGSAGSDITDGSSEWYGGQGGGACYGANGSNGQDAWYDDDWGQYTQGNGGNGASCTIVGTDATEYGCGGNGGHGGGGGGAEGGTTGSSMPVSPHAGYGGSGSNGGLGKEGCVVVYY